METKGQDQGGKTVGGGHQIPQRKGCQAKASQAQRPVQNVDRIS